MGANKILNLLEEYKDSTYNSEVMLLKKYKKSLKKEDWDSFIDRYKDRFIKTESFYIYNLYKTHFNEEQDNYIDLSKKISHNILERIINSLE